uniref:RNA polymerase sigma-70 domain-containing protein n=1 Tax=Thermogemmatispora argillosa TaxID=2045280 RepID=A0A455T3U6_9CHLR|nr:hypothetical protein KTA_02530 [Thermogemmatispora argillosa]
MLPSANPRPVRAGRAASSPHIAPRRGTVVPSDPLHPVHLYLEDLGAFPRPDPDSPLPVADPGRAPGTALVERNLRLVVSVARTYAPLLRAGRLSLDLADLIQAGNLGLLEAARRYDPGRGYRFSTYAVWWIRLAICQAIWEADTIRLPSTMRTRLPTRSAEGTDEARGAVPGAQAVPRAVSLEALTREERRQILVLPDPTRSDPAAIVCRQHEAQERRRWLEEAMQRVLSPRERAVLRALLEPGDRWHPVTLGEVARTLGLHRESVRQLRDRALSRLRAAWLADSQRETNPERNQCCSPEQGGSSHDPALVRV